MTAHNKPSVLVAYPSSFYYCQGQYRDQIKSSPLLLASYLSRHFPVKYADFELLIGRAESAVQVRRFGRMTKKILAEMDFDILAISCWTSLCYQATMTIARACRELYPDRLIIVGGYHPTARPKDFITGANVIDYVIRGEGEIACREIADSFHVTGRPSETKIVTGPALEPKDYVGMNWDLVDEIIETYFRDDLGTLVTFLSRGCPFGCTYCMETIKNRRWRPASIEYALNEVRNLMERYRFAGMGFGDACFGVRPQWRREFLRELANLKPTSWILFETRPEYLDAEDIELLAQMKSQVQIGLESGSPRMLQIMNKTRQPEKFLATFREVSRRLSDHGVVHGANLIFNHPGETRETIEETYAFMDEEMARGQSTLIWTCNNFSHFPGSYVDNNRSYYEQKYGTEFLCPEWWKIDEDQNETSRKVVPSGDLSGDRINLWQEMLKDRDQRMRDSLTPEALSLAANILYPGWKNDPKFVEI